MIARLLKDKISVLFPDYFFDDKQLPRLQITCTPLKRAVQGIQQSSSRSHKVLS